MALILALLLLLFAHPLRAQTGSNRQFHVTLNALPSSLTAPTPIEGGALTTSVNVDFIVLTNPDASAHTVTVEDCTATTPFTPLNAVSLPANTTWGLPFGNTRFVGCFKWSSSSALVQGSVVGTR